MYAIFKRVFDFLLALVLILVLLPMFILLYIIIKLDSKGPIFFKQKRIGLNKTHFNILKYRSMRIDTPKDTPTHLLDNPQAYITKVGAFLRKSSLDEVPQLFNILIGEMSFVGPRPALWNQYDLIAERDKYGANNVPVGLTGWAQVNGRDELPIALKAKLDGDYVDKKSFMFDIKCLVKTFSAVSSGSGVREGGVK